MSKWVNESTNKKQSAVYSALLPDLKAPPPHCEVLHVISEFTLEAKLS